MSDERLITPVLHIEGGDPNDLGPHYIPPGKSIYEWGAEHGLTYRTEYRREPWTETELRRGALESTVAELRNDFPTGDYPPVVHGSDDPCTYCEAIRFLEDRDWPWPR